MTPSKGVAFTAPPTRLLADATKALEASLAMLPPDAQGAVIGLATDTGWNAAVVHKVHQQWTVGAWVGKDWGTGITGGGVIRGSW